MVLQHQGLPVSFSLLRFVHIHIHPHSTKILKISRLKSFQCLQRPQSYPNPNSISPVAFSRNEASSGTDALSRERRRFMFANSTFIQHSFSRKRRWFMLTNSTFIHQHSRLNETFSGTDWRPASSREEGRHTLQEKCNLMKQKHKHLRIILWYLLLSDLLPPGRLQISRSTALRCEIRKRLDISYFDPPECGWHF